MFKRILLSVFIFFKTCDVSANNVILMIGDGMGANQIMCTQKENDLFLNKLPRKGWVKTHSASHPVTDSAASATAYSCGIKTTNKYLAMNVDQKPCKTIAEQAVEKGYFVGIRSTDMSTGATPSAFYAHNPNRRDAAGIEKDKQKAMQQMDIQVPVLKISEATVEILAKAKKSKKPFFIMIEGALIDVKSHENNLRDMQLELVDFDKAVQTAATFVQENPNTTLIITADHETGGLTQNCAFTTHEHTSTDVPYYTVGDQQGVLVDESIDNTSIYHGIKDILFN